MLSGIAPASRAVWFTEIFGDSPCRFPLRHLACQIARGREEDSRGHEIHVRRGGVFRRRRETRQGVGASLRQRQLRGRGRGYRGDAHDARHRGSGPRHDVGRLLRRAEAPDARPGDAGTRPHRSLPRRIRRRVREARRDAHHPPFAGRGREGAMTIVSPHLPNLASTSSSPR